MAVADRRNRGAILGLTGPAYLWLTATIFLPLSAMLYCSFLAKSPLVPQPASFTLKHYAAFIDKPVYQQLMLWSLELGAVVTICLPRHRISGGARARQGDQGTLARGDVPDGGAAVLEQRAGAHLLLDHGAAERAGWRTRRSTSSRPARRRSICSIRIRRS